MNKWFFIVAGCALLLLAACLNSKPETVTEKVMEEYRQAVKELSAETEQFVTAVQQDASILELQQQFKKARASYKKVEWLAEYYYPYTAKKINGPALAEVEADEKNIIIQPEGFQVVEKMLFTPGDEHTKDLLLQQAKVLHSNIGRLQYMVQMQETTDAHIFDALRLQVFRIITLGITGFDSPVANNSLEEAAASLQSISDNLALYEIKLNDADRNLEKSLQQAILLLSSAKDFNSFNRMTCITQYLNPVSKNILLFQKRLAIPVFTEPRALNANAATLFEKDIFNADFYTSSMALYSSPEKVMLGKKFFYDGILSGDGKRSCATCHKPEKAFTDGLVTSLTLDGKTNIRRNTPTLINAAVQPSLFYDTRVTYLEDQAKDVISNKDEMHGSLLDAVKDINRSNEYKKLFRKVYPDKEISELQIRNSIAAYIRSLICMNSRFDQYTRGNERAMSATEINGFNLFAGKAKCSTCHFIPLLNGSNPPQFSKIDAEIIGVPANADSLHPVPDEDEGKYTLYKIDLHKHAFKTPTLRNIELTAPYMHNGVFKTLEEVVEFYNRGGGAGLGLHMINQTLPDDKLHLTGPEKKSLVAFMKSLTDTSVVR